MFPPVIIQAQYLAFRHDIPRHKKELTCLNLNEKLESSAQVSTICTYLGPYTNGR